MANTYTKAQVLAYMQTCLANGEYQSDGGEVNCTTLAEDAGNHFNAHGPAPLCEIPDEFFDWSYLAAKIWEKGVVR